MVGEQPAAWLEEVWPLLGNCYTPHPEGDGLVYLPLHVERERKLELSQKRAVAGRQGGLAKADGRGQPEEEPKQLPGNSQASATEYSSGIVEQVSMPLQLPTTATPGKRQAIATGPWGEDPALWLWGIWLELWGGKDTAKIAFTDKRRKVLEKLWRNSLRKQEDPERVWRAMLAALMAEDWFKQKPHLRYPDNNLRTDEQQNRWLLVGLGEGTGPSAQPRRGRPSPAEQLALDDQSTEFVVG
jgi:hypothetical protein